jgi:hypothetical protein
MTWSSSAKIALSLWLLLLTVSPSAEPGQSEKQLFDGKSFEGWEGDVQHTFRIRDGAVVGGVTVGPSTAQRVPVHAQELQELRAAR